MGHKGNMEARYTTNKSVLVEALVNEIRETFKRCEEFLDIEIKKEDPLMKQKKAAKITIDNATPEQIQRIQAIMGISVQIVQRAISTEESEKLIAMDWRFVGVLPNGKVVLQK